MTTEQYNKVLKKIAIQNKKQNDLFHNYEIGKAKKATRLTFARNAKWLNLNHSKEFYSHTKYVAV